MHHMTAERDKTNAANRARYKANRDKILASNRAWAKAHRDKRAAYIREYHKANKNNEKYLEKRRAASLTWAKAHRDEINAYVRAWTKANPDKNSAKERNRRARKHQASGTHTADNLLAIRASQKDRCIYCRKKLGGKGHLDHIIPLSRGGSNWPYNLQWLCQQCNSRKHAKDPIDFARENGLLI